MSTPQVGQTVGLVSSSVSSPVCSPELTRLMTLAHRAITQGFNGLRDVPQVDGGPLVVFFSLCDGETRAVVRHVSGADLQAVWAQAIDALSPLRSASGRPWKWLRVDWVSSASEPVALSELKRRWVKVKRNYYRCGLVLGRSFQWALTEQELNANACLYAGGNTPHVALNSDNFQRCVKHRFGGQAQWPLTDETQLREFKTAGVFVDGLRVLPLDTQPLSEGRRRLKPLDSELLPHLIQTASRFLASQVKPDGQFVYGHFPVFGRTIDTYNTLRHASTVYAMLEAWELTREPGLMQAIDLALDYLLRECIKTHQRPAWGKVAFNVEGASGEIKLGASAVAILALVKYQELTGSTSHSELMDSLAKGIASMQCPDTGRFVHVLHADTLEMKDEFRVVYYDGEAAFALMRLYGLSRDARWLAVVERAFEYFIAARHWRHHDHWLSYCVNELTLHKPEARYFEFGVRNIQGYLGFIETRQTTFPTLLELSMAFEQMLERLKVFPAHASVLNGLDVSHFYRAMHARANALMNGFFFPELAMYFDKPKSIVGSLFIRHHGFRVRIDDVEHYLSGFIAYLKYLRRQS